MAHFVRSFDCMKESHALWLKDVGAVMAETIGGGRGDVLSVVNNNPLPGKPEIANPIDWAYIHFQLCMKYTNAVLNGKAFVPPILS